MVYTLEYELTEKGRQALEEDTEFAFELMEPSLKKFAGENRLVTRLLRRLQSGPHTVDKKYIQIAYDKTITVRDIEALLTFEDIEIQSSHYSQERFNLYEFGQESYNLLADYLQHKGLIRIED
jgi:hypothetical protein